MIRLKACQHDQHDRQHATRLKAARALNARAIMLWFALLSIFIWQYAITHAIVGAPSGSMSTYYYGRCLPAFVIGVAFFRLPALRSCEWKPLSLPLALLASTAPLALTMCPQNELVSSL